MNDAFEFEFDDGSVTRLARLFGVQPATAALLIQDRELRIRFGPWHLQTTIDNVTSVTKSGPYGWRHVAGPARLSLRDRGVTFATTTRQGVCLTFRDSVPAIEPTGRLRHPGATVTVSEPDRLVAVLRRAGVGARNTSGLSPASS
jgi:hypothetical protein